MKKRAFIIGLCALFISMVSFTSCDDDDDEVKIEPSLGLAEESHVFGSEAGEYALAVFANGAWTLTQEGDWFSVDKTSGEGNGVVKVSAKANTTDGERTGKITVKSEGLTDQVFQITQEVENVVLKVLGENAYLIKPEGGSMKIAVEANVGYTYEMSEWVKVAQGFGVSQSEITLQIAPNFGGTTRKATVVIKNAKSASVVKEISLTQEPVLAEIPTLISFDGLGGQEVLIPLNENLTWKIGEDKPSWLICTPKASGVVVSAEKNEDPSSRRHFLTFEDEATGFRVTVLVEQESYDDIQMDLSTDPGSQGSSEVAINSSSVASKHYRYLKNVTHGDRVVARSSDDTWLHASVEGNLITIELDENTGEARTGEVLLTAMDGDRALITRKIPVSQEKKVVEPYITLDKTSHVFTFGNSGETVEITVDANVEWDITEYQASTEISYVVEGNKITFTYTQQRGPIVNPYEYAVHRKGFRPTDEGALTSRISLTTTLP